MIYTVTFNPSIDYIIHSPDFTTGKINKIEKEYLFPGGKGINVSLVLNNLGIDSIAMGFLAGFTGHEIENLLFMKEIKTDFIYLKNGHSRINVKLKSGEETELNSYGPEICSESVDFLIEKIKKLNEEDILVLGGSVPKTLPEDIYEKILDCIAEKNIKSVVDATGKLLLNALKYKPFLVKPNWLELEGIFNVKLNSVSEITEYAIKLRKMGAENVIVSMGEQGAVFIDNKNNSYYLPVPECAVVNSVGAGDSMIAGFLYEYLNSSDMEKSFIRSVATGTASVVKSGFASKTDVDSLYEILQKQNRP